jgi:hypothetical protein
METSAREMVNIEETFALLVRRVVEARRHHAMGITPNLPNSTARTLPLDPLPYGSEKELTAIPMSDGSDRMSGLRWYQKILYRARRLKCW